MICGFLARICHHLSKVFLHALRIKHGDDRHRMTFNIFSLIRSLDTFYWFEQAIGTSLGERYLTTILIVQAVNIYDSSSLVPVYHRLIWYKCQEFVQPSLERPKTNLFYVS